jgi:hypothetical protein
MHKYENLNPIFIGGTGRSGTTIISKFIGTHDEVVKIPIESRYIIDKNGLLDLFDSLTKNYSLDQARVAIRDFEHKIQDMSNPYKAPYLSWDIEKIIDKSRFLKYTEELINDLTYGTFESVDYSTQDKYNIHFIRKLSVPANLVLGKLSELIMNKKISIFGTSLKNKKPKEKMYIPKYYENEQELVELLKVFTLNIFSGIFEEKNEIKAWCEDTPANILNIHFLQKLFPKGKYIHVMRHPVAVAYSFKKVFWAPNNLKQCCDLLDGLYGRLMDVHKKYNGSENYLFIKLEDLANEKQQKNFVEFLELDTKKFSGEVSIDLARMNYFIKEMSKKDIDYVQNRLSKYISFFDYDFINNK